MPTSTSVATRRVSRSLVIGVNVGGVAIPPYGNHWSVPLDPTEVQVLARLVGGEAPDSVDGPIVDKLLDLLDERDLLYAGREGDAVPTASPARPDRTDEPDPTIEIPAQLVWPTPTLLRCVGGSFQSVGHDGGIRFEFSPIELVAATSLRMPRTIELAFEQHQHELGDAALDKDEFVGLVRRLLASGLVVAFDPSNAGHVRETRQTHEMREAFRRRALVDQEFDRLEEEKDREGGAGRVRVIAYNNILHTPPASLAQVMASAMAADDGALLEHYDIRPRLIWEAEQFERTMDGPAAILLFSNYIWSVESNLALSARAKDRNPHHVTIHGGPDTPKYEADTQRFFAENPQVDVAVHGEGEATFVDLLRALRGAIGDGPPDLSALRDVPGLTFRDGPHIVRTEKRDRITDVDQLPSPVMLGVYDGFVPGAQGISLVLETNRGCPYGCTFCDWGSATLARIRKFDIDRVYQELQWAAEHSFRSIALADANFGIFERDVEIAEHLAKLKRTYGFPTGVGINYAKNTVKHLSHIIEIFTESGILAEGKMSAQSFDTETLTTIRRKNIKVEKYQELATEFRRNDLPLSVDLMMGLPGSTPESFRKDIQVCIDRNVKTIVHPTMLLANSPMNEPSYRLENGIVARPGEVVRQSATFDEQDWEHMDRLLWTYWVVENYGVLRQVAMYVRSATGLLEVDLYQGLADAAAEDSERWPLTAVMLRVLPQLMVPPVSWRLFLDEVKAYLTEVVGVPDDAALDTVLAVQHALLPARDRHFPLTVDLPHDYVAWHREVTRARDTGHQPDWPEVVEPLGSRPPGRLTVDDPFDSCQSFLGDSCLMLSMSGNSVWDLDSPVARPRIGV